MKKNIGTADKIVRLLIAIVIGILFFTHRIEGTTAAVLLVVASVMLLTALVGICPLYIPFKIRTNKNH